MDFHCKNRLPVPIVVEASGMPSANHQQKIKARLTLHKENNTSLYFGVLFSFAAISVGFSYVSASQPIFDLPSLEGDINCKY